MGGLQTAITPVTAVSSFALMLLPRRKWNQPLQLLHWLHVNLATPINILWDWFPFKDQLVSIKTPDLNSLLCLFSVPQLLVASLGSLWKWKSPISLPKIQLILQVAYSVRCLPCGDKHLRWLFVFMEVSAEVDMRLDRFSFWQHWAPAHLEKQFPDSHPTDPLPQQIWYKRP